MTCKDCIHYEICKEKEYNGYAYVISDNNCPDFKNSSLLIELPCKIGDTVYVIDNKQHCYACTFYTDSCYIKCPFPDRLEKVVKKAIVKGISISQNTVIQILAKIPETNDTLSYQLHYLSTDFNKTIFLSEEEAEQALKEREENA